MAKVKMGKWEYTERELESMFDEATVRGRLASKAELQAKSAHYDPATKRVVVELKNGATFIFPCELAQGLSRASVDDLALVELGPRGRLGALGKTRCRFLDCRIDVRRLRKQALDDEVGTEGRRRQRKAYDVCGQARRAAHSRHETNSKPQQTCKASTSGQSARTNVSTSLELPIA